MAQQTVVGTAKTRFEDQGNNDLAALRYRTELYCPENLPMYVYPNATFNSCSWRFSPINVPEDATLVRLVFKFRAKSSGNSLIKKLLFTASNDGENAQTFELPKTATDYPSDSYDDDYTLEINYPFTRDTYENNFKVNIRVEATRAPSSKTVLMYVRYIRMAITYSDQAAFVKQNGVWRRAGAILRKDSGSWTRIGPEDAFGS